jgi:hypothetical protein
MTELNLVQKFSTSSAETSQDDESEAAALSAAITNKSLQQRAIRAATKRSQFGRRRLTDHNRTRLLGGGNGVHARDASFGDPHVQTGRGRVRPDLSRYEPMIHFLRCNAARFLLVGAVISFWWAGAQIAQEREADRAAESAREPSRQKKHPQLSQAVVNNNRTAALQLPPNLEGTAVIYPEEVDALVSADGTFRNGLSASELARRLRIAREQIARSGSIDEVDPDAVLFNVVTGRLSEGAKAQARRSRAIQARMDVVASAVGDEWVETRLGITLSVLMHPSVEQKAMLDAICRSALHLPRQPGVKINAVPFLSDRDGARTAFSGGFLPLEASTERITALVKVN